VTTVPGEDAELPDLIPLFFFDQQRKGIADRTIRQRKSDLKGFHAEFPDPRDVTPRLLEVWLAKTERQVSSERQILRSVSEFYKFGNSAGLLTGNPALEPLKKRPQGPAERVVIETADVERAVEQSSGLVRLWIALSAFQGLPCRDIADLTVDAFDSLGSPTTVRLDGSSKMTRSTNLHPTVIAAMSAVALPDRVRLFPEFDSQKISKRIGAYLRSVKIRASAKDFVWWYRQKVEDEGVDFGRGAGSSTSTRYEPTNDEQLILMALEPESAGAADSYRQALRDLAAPDRVSFRGTAHELRTVLLDVLDALAPDEQVAAAEDFKYEPRQTTPTHAQKAQFILRKRSGRTASRPAEISLERSELLFGRLSRAVYSSGSKSSHEVMPKSEVLQYKRYVDAVLFELLGISS
jgi:hypothetical protein